MIESSVYIRKNVIETFDSWFNPYKIMEDEFYDVGSLTTVPLVTKKPGCDNSVFVKAFYFHSESILHERRIYNMLGFLGNMGGVWGIIIAIFGFFVFPYSQFSYNLKIFEKLYLVRTTDPDLVNNKF